MEELRKQKAVELLQKLAIYKPYINGFKAKASKVCFFENYGGFWAYQEPELQDKITEIEKKYGCKVYAVTHEFTEFGELYSMLVVPKEQEDWEYLVERDGNIFYCFAYVWNKSFPSDSEFGTVGVQSFGGGIRRAY